VIACLTRPNSGVTPAPRHRPSITGRHDWAPRALTRRPDSSSFNPANRRMARRDRQPEPETGRAAAPVRAPGCGFSPPMKLLSNSSVPGTF